jgi:hypothetical protein
MLGAVAIFYFCATALAMVVACCGPDARAKVCAGYLMCAWALSNRIFLTSGADEALRLFSPWDLGAVLVIYVMMLRWPTRWILVLLTALTTQVVFQVYYGITGENLGGHYLLNNEVLYWPQLVAVTIPTISKWRRVLQRWARRRDGRRRFRDEYPPAPSWQPHEEMTKVGGGETR